MWSHMWVLEMTCKPSGSGFTQKPAPSLWTVSHILWNITKWHCNTVSEGRWHTAKSWVPALAHVSWYFSYLGKYVRGWCYPIFFRLCSVVVLPQIPLCHRFLNAIDYLAFLMPVYPYNSLHHITLVSIYTRNQLEKRFGFHQKLPFFCFLFFWPFSDSRANIAFPSPCLLCSQTTPLIKAEIFYWSNCKSRHIYSGLFWCRLTRVKAACGLPGREEYPREVTGDALNRLSGAAQASFA